MKLKAHLVSFFVMILGTGTTLGALVAMNAHEFKPEDTAPRVQVAFERKAPKKKKKKQKQKTTRAKKMKTTNAPPPPTPLLGMEMGGLDLGLNMNIGTLPVNQTALKAMPRASVMTEDAVDSKPKAKQRVSATYPKRARAKGVEGFVKMNLLVDEMGRVNRIKIIESRPAGTFEEAAKAAVNQWTFQPALYQGNPVKVWATQTLRFRLQ